MPANTETPETRNDPYKNFRFRLKWDGRYVAGVSKVSPLKRTTQVVAHRAQGDPSKPRLIPAQSEHEPITLERGVTHDVAFELWANKVWDYRNAAIDDRPGDAGNQQPSLNDFRKDIILEVYNEAGQKVAVYNIHRCWPSEFKSDPEFDANGNAVAIEHIKLENEGWEPDPSVQMPDPWH
jgi:phage tail-like protein